MPPVETVPVQDSVAKVGNELAVGEDLEFQRKWWRFEAAVWYGFLVLVLLDVAGLFGRGPAAKGHGFGQHHLMEINYEWVERFSTPSILTLHFSPGAVRDGKLHLWVSDSVIKALGNQRVTPQPLTSETGNGGIFYTFPATTIPGSVEFALQPANPGVSHFQILLTPSGSPADAPLDELTGTVITMP